jgi:formylglycine-generating enzyme required for sulfatase activity
MNGSDYLKELQEIEQQQGISRLRTIAAEFFSTLDRLPKLKQEVDAMQQMQGVNLDDLATSLEQRLDKAADLMARLDLLPADIRNAQGLEGFEHGLQNAMTLRTIDRWVSEFDSKCNEAKARIIQQKDALDRAQKEKAEAELLKILAEARAKKEQEKEAERRKAELELGKKLVGMFEFIQVSGGSFQMGANDCGENAKPVHEVKLDNFHIGRYPVTQKQWLSVMGNNPSKFQSGENHPVERVNWHDAQQFITRLNQLTGKQYRLPTEAEWEYAARSGGKKFTWSGTNSARELEEYTWFNVNSGGTTHTVGLKKPNSLGIYDMSGNVWEWCSDWYDEGYYRHSAISNPPGASSGQYRLLRGGSWYNVDVDARAASRNWVDPVLRHDRNGFRLALSSQ